MGVCDRVLIVDESAVVRVLLRGALEGAGYWVEEAQDIDAARELIEAYGYDLVVTGLGIRRHSGFELLKPARSAGAAVVVLTASPSADLHARALLLGADVCLAKHQGVATEVVRVARRLLQPPTAVVHDRQAGPLRAVAVA